jgi:hypothetical protein
MSGEPKPEQRDVQRSDGPAFDTPVAGRVAGLKAGRIIVADDGTMRFAGLAAAQVAGTFYDAEATAHCSKGRSHQVPAWDCSCGFHMAFDRAGLDVMYPDWDDGTLVLLEVEGWGSIVEHENGLRAQHQRVLGVKIPNWCAFCDKPAAAAGAGLADNSQFGRTDLLHLVSTCDDCAKRKCLGSRRFSPSDLAGALGVEVSHRSRTAPVAEPRPSAVAANAAKVISVLAIAALLAGAIGGWGFSGFGLMCLAGCAALSPTAGFPKRQSGRIAMRLAAGVLLTASLVFAVVNAVEQVEQVQVSARDGIAAELVDVAANLGPDPYQAAWTLTSTVPHWWAVPLGDGDGVRGLVAAGRYSATGECVVVLDGAVAYQGTLAADACFGHGQVLVGNSAVTSETASEPAQ